MCSIVGYVGKQRSKSFVLEGLARLEYRGYDSAGFACVVKEDNILSHIKAVGGLSQLVEKCATSSLDGFLGIGHSRWASHGKPSELNAHPHVDCQKKVAIVHNGIIENYFSIKKELELLGHTFYSDTDTEVIAHLYEQLARTGQRLWDRMVNLVNQLQGSYALVCVSVDEPDMLVVARKRSPVCIGIGDGEMFVASDSYAFAGKTDTFLFLPDNSFAFVKKDSIEVYDFAGNLLVCNPVISDVAWVEHDKQGYEHFMLKEIYEQKSALYKTVHYLRSLHDTIADHMGLTNDQLGKIKGVNFIGCGASWYAGRIAQFFFEQITKIPVSVSLASEFRYMPFFGTDKLHVAISQSGETADTLEALRLVKVHGVSTVALTNVAVSTIVREADGYLLTQAGREIAVASTKGFSTQLAALYWLAHRIALEKKLITNDQMVQANNDILYAANVLEATIATYRDAIISCHAKKYSFYSKIICLGRNGSYPFAMEAALKFKELAYFFAQCYPAGELKHGPLALIDEEIPVFIFSHQDPLIYQKLLANAYEVKARNGHIVAFAFEGQDELCVVADLCFVIPRVASLLGSLAMTGLMQFFIYSIAKELGRPIDKPRNLAKSVTIE